jgi:hypothetical protein
MACNEASIIRACKAGGDYVSVANACNVSSTGPVNIGPLAKLGARTFTCSRLFGISLKEQGERLFDSLDAKMSAFLSLVLNLKKKPTEDLELFEGEMVDGIFALIYLLQKPAISSRTCMILKPLSTAIQNYQKFNTVVKWTDFCVSWQWSFKTDSFKLTVPGNNINTYLNTVSKCLSQKRFFVSLLCLLARPRTNDDGQVLLFGHANVILFDGETGLLSRFDPYESASRKFDTRGLDKALASTFSALPGFKRFEGPPDLSAKERQGLQTRAEADIAERRVTDPLGFCLPWSILYLEARITSPLQNPDSIPQILDIWAQKHKTSLTKVIRGFTATIEKLRKNVHEEFLSNYRENADLNSFLYSTVLDQLIRHI